MDIKNVHGIFISHMYVPQAAAAVHARPGQGIFEEKKLGAGAGPFVGA
jgi:hypothetical protein